jgi:hypothetical protein
MRTKTLLIAAAALAAGVLASSAQTYSLNIVGYVNVTIPGSYKLTAISNPLLTGTNGASQVLTGLIGGEVLYVWNSAGNFYYQYVYGGAGAGTGGGFPSDWYDQNPGTAVAIPGTVYDSGNDAWWAPQPILGQGKGFYIQNPATALTNTFVGTVVLQNTNTPVALPGSYAMTLTGSTVPIGGNLTNLTLPFIGGEVVFVWNSAGNFYYQYVYGGPGSGTGGGYASDYYDQNPGTAVAIPGTVYDAGNDAWWAPPFNVAVGQGFFVQNPASTLQWKQNVVVP